MNQKFLASTLFAACIAASAASAQSTTVSSPAGTVTGTTTGTTTTAGTTAATTDSIGAFDKLSPGNQKIARDLFDAQTVSSTSTGTPMSLDQIAAAKVHEGWGEVFHQMHSQGLVQARNLGEVVSGHSVAPTTTGGAAAGSSVGTTTGLRTSRASARTSSKAGTTITNGSGRTMVWGGDGDKSAYGITTASGASTGTGANNGSMAGGGSAHSVVVSANGNSGGSALGAGASGSHGGGNSAHGK